MSEEIAELKRRGSQVLWHPFTPLDPTSELPLIASGHGSRLKTAEGEELIDAISSWWVTAHGHAHPYIAKKVSEQLSILEQVIFADLQHELAITLAERLLQMLPSNQERVFFSDDGSTAVEVALKMAIQYWQFRGELRTKFVTLKEGYHGDTIGAMSLGADEDFNAPFAKLMFPTVTIPAPTPGREEESLAALERVLEQEQIAGFIFEPLVQGAGGMIFHTPEALSRLLEVTQAKGVLNIADEVMTGFYRTGSVFASNTLSVSPDIICLSKALTGGTLAMAVTTASHKVSEEFYSSSREKMLLHGHSFTANCLGCAAAHASLDLFDSIETARQLKLISTSHEEFVRSLLDNPKVENPRTCGIIAALDVHSDKETSYYNPVRDQFYSFFLERGVLLRPLGNVLYILPPLCISGEDLERVYSVIREGLETVV